MVGINVDRGTGSIHAESQTHARVFLTMPRMLTSSRACSADEDFWNLQKTTPFEAMRSVLQYSMSWNLHMSS